MVLVLRKILFIYARVPEGDSTWITTLLVIEDSLGRVAKCLWLTKQ